MDVAHTWRRREMCNIGVKRGGKIIFSDNEDDDRFRLVSKYTKTNNIFSTSLVVQSTLIAIIRKIIDVEFHISAFCNKIQLNIITYFVY